MNSSDLKVSEIMGLFIFVQKIVILVACIGCGESGLCGQFLHLEGSSWVADLFSGLIVLLTYLVCLLFWVVIAT